MHVLMVAFLEWIWFYSTALAVLQNLPRMKTVIIDDYFEKIPYKC